MALMVNTNVTRIKGSSALIYGESDLIFCLVATIFAYGQTSSGKTFTMRGITENAVKDIFDHIKNVSFLAIC